MFDDQGNVVFGLPYPRDSLTGKGSIKGVQVKGISPEWWVKFHAGYKVDIDDHRDVIKFEGVYINIYGKLQGGH